MTSEVWRQIVRNARNDTKQGFLEVDAGGNVRLTRLAEDLLALGKNRYGVKTEMDTKEFATGSNIRADDLGEDYKGVFVMGKTSRQDFDGDTKLVISGELEGAQTQLVLNQTNLRRIQEKHGFESDDWIGKKVTLITEYTPFNGKDVLAVRVKK